MKVKLLAYTPLPAGLIARAGRSCYSVKPASEITLTQPEIGKQLSLMHDSVLEHAVFTFSIEGISRVCSHQLVRHRLASFSQQSMRYVDVHKLMDHVVTPATVHDRVQEEYAEGETINDMPLTKALEDYQKALHELMKVLDANDIPSEDARYYIPMGVETNVVMTMNLRELSHFLGLRECSRAQDEIRQVAIEIHKIMKEECPELEKFLGPQCVQLGYCPEHKSCGKYPGICEKILEEEWRSNPFAQHEHEWTEEHIKKSVNLRKSVIVPKGGNE